jgi:hypothetical protein
VTAGSNGGAIASYQWYSTSRGKLLDLDGFTGATTATLSIASVGSVIPESYRFPTLQDSFTVREIYHKLLHVVQLFQNSPIQ